MSIRGLSLICNRLLQFAGMTLDGSFLVFHPHFIPYVELTLIRNSRYGDMAVFARAFIRMLRTDFCRSNLMPASSGGCLAEKRSQREVKGCFEQSLNWIFTSDDYQSGKRMIVADDFFKSSFGNLYPANPTTRPTHPNTCRLRSFSHHLYG